MNTHNIETKWQNGQYDYFSQKWDEKWQRHFSDRDGLKNKIVNLEYEKFYDVNNAFEKLDKALQICEFLYQLKEAKPPQDTEKIIITTLVSCAEAVYRINKPDESISENLVKGFFKPVKQQLNYKIREHVGNMPYKRVFEPVEVLYLVRNDYIHNGNFTGVFFRNSQSENHVYNLGSFYYSEKYAKTKLIQASSECKLTYDDFFENIFRGIYKKYRRVL